MVARRSAIECLTVRGVAQVFGFWRFTRFRARCSDAGSAQSDQRRLASISSAACRYITELRVELFGASWGGAQEDAQEPRADL